MPKEVSVNQAKSAEHYLRQRLQGAAFEEHIEFKERSDTIGSGITLIALDCNGNMLSASALGAKGRPAEIVGKEAAERLMQEIAAKKAVDSHAADQLIPFMALAKGYSTIHCSRLTQHCLTNIAVCEKMLGVHFDVKGEPEKPAEVFVEGCALR